jgi:Fur family ferric uptake transcriptional regulator
MKKTRSTSAKAKILRLISDSKTALSQSEIQNALEGFCDRVTIYRVLNRLVNEELIHKISTIEGTLKYASCSSCTDNHLHNHLHFSCEKCKKVSCLSHIRIDTTIPENYQPNHFNYVVSGICPECV